MELDDEQPMFPAPKMETPDNGMPPTWFLLLFVALAGCAVLAVFVAVLLS